MRNGEWTPGFFRQDLFRSLTLAEQTVLILGFG